MIMGNDLSFDTRPSAQRIPEPGPPDISALNTSPANPLEVLSSDEHMMFFHGTRIRTAPALFSSVSPHARDKRSQR